MPRFALGVAIGIGTMSLLGGGAYFYFAKGTLLRYRSRSRLLDRMTQSPKEKRRKNLSRKPARNRKTSKGFT